MGLPMKMTKETLGKRHDMYLRKPPSYLCCVALRLHSCSCTALYFLPPRLAFDCGRYRATYSSSLLCGGNCPRQIRGIARLRPRTHTTRRRVLPSFIYCPCCQMLEREKRGLRKKRERASLASPFRTDAPVRSSIFGGFAVVILSIDFQFFTSFSFPLLQSTPPAAAAARKQKVERRGRVEGCD